MSRQTALLLLAAYLCLAFTLTHLPGQSLPSVGISQWIPDADKFAHAGLYFVLAGLLANCLRFRLRSNRVIVFITMIVLAAYAAFDEWSQQFSPLRSPDLMDFVADMIGASLGVSTFAVWRWFRHRSLRRSGSGNSAIPSATVDPNMVAPAAGRRMVTNRS